MQLTPLDIQQKQFRIRYLRGLDSKEVEAFLHQVADYVSGLLSERDELLKELAEKRRQINAYREREATLKNTLISAQKAVEQMRANAEKEARLLVSEAEVKAERLLNNAHQRLAQLHADISELKRQRTQFELKLRTTIETYLKMLEAQKEEEAEIADLESKITYFPKS